MQDAEYNKKSGYMCNGKFYTEWIYFGHTIPYSDYLLYQKDEEVGQCPFCGRCGLTGKYGSKKKHIRVCAEKMLS